MKIRGNTIGTPLKPGKNLVKATDLTPEEQAQARKNIGITDAPTDEKYFDIDYDGLVSLKPEYRGHPANDTLPYSVSDNGVGVDGSKNNELPETIVIPDVIGGTAVSALSEGMFDSNLRVKSITIPSHITVIPKKFVNYTWNLVELNGTENVESVGLAAFQGCSIKKALFPNLNQVDGYVFNMAVYLSIVDIGNTVTSIPDYCFMGCESLSLVLGGASVTSIGNYAFFATRNLKNLPLVANVKSMGNNAFTVSRVHKAGSTDWWTFKASSGCTFGSNATPAHVNPSAWWGGCTYEPCENPLGSTFHQTNPEWKDIQIAGSANVYTEGCEEISIAHIYSALTGVEFDSPQHFIENIVGGIDNGRLLKPSGSNGTYVDADFVKWLTALGLDCEQLTNYTETNLQKVYDALKEGALIFTSIFPNHAAVIYGIAPNGEVMTLDSASYQLGVGVYEAKTFQQRIWSICKGNSSGIIIVKNPVREE